MSDPHDHLVPAALVLVAVALPLLLLTAGVLVVAIISTCSTDPARRQHSRDVLDDLTVYGVSVLRARGRSRVGKRARRTTGAGSSAGVLARPSPRRFGGPRWRMGDNATPDAAEREAGRDGR